MKRLHVPHSRQEKKNTCGVGVLRMLMRYWGVKLSEKEVLEKVPLHSWGAYTTDLGVIALKRGFEVEAWTFHLGILGELKLAWGAEVNLDILRRVKPRASDRATYESMVRYVKAGGKLDWDTLRVTRLKKWLDKKVPCIISVNTAALGNYWRRFDNGHYLVVEGYEGDEFWVVDPDKEESKARYAISQELLLPAWSINSYNSSDYLMVVYPRGSK